MRQLHPGAQRHLPQMRHLRRHQRLQLSEIEREIRGGDPMVAEVFASVSAFKTMFDLAKALKDINDAAIRNGAVIELQEQILAAQQAQTAAMERISELEKQSARFETWE